MDSPDRWALLEAEEPVEISGLRVHPENLDPRALQAPLDVHPWQLRTSLQLHSIMIPMVVHQKLSNLLKMMLQLILLHFQR